MAGPRRLGRDRRVERRILVSVGALVAIYAVLVGAFVLAGVAGWIIGAIAVVLAVVQVKAAQRAALHAVKAEVAHPSQQPELHAAIARLCVQAGLAQPRLMVSRTGVPNAMAVSSLRGNATICVDQALVDLLEPAELEAVLAHELSHVAHRDVAVMTVAGFFSLAASLIVKWGWRFGHPIARVGTLAAATAAWAASFVVLRALGRTREYAADRGAAVLTGRPSALVSALLKTEERIAGIPAKDLRAVQPVAALAFAPLGAPIKPLRRVWTRVAATHPTTEHRIAALQQMERELQGTRKVAG